VTKLQAIWRHFGTVIYNFGFTHFPSHTVRQAVLKLWGAKIGKDVGIFRGTSVLGIHELEIGDFSTIGWRCLLDARGGLVIGTNVVIASDVQFIAGHHLPNSDDFSYIIEPTIVEDFVWIASRSMVLEGLTVGRGAVVAAGSLVRTSIPPMTIAAGIPAKPVRERRSSLDYVTTFRPKLY
jgi:acetyltransferase-like isoleucine patch superfamily enzyme